MNENNNISIIYIFQLYISSSTNGLIFIVDKTNKNKRK